MLRSFQELYPFLVGVFLTIGILYIFSYAGSKSDKAYFLFGMISLLAGLWFGFVRQQEGDATYSMHTKIFALFYSSITLLIPWFIGYYGTLWKPKWLWFISLLWIIAAVVYRIGPEISPAPWLYVGFPAFVLTFSYGIISSVQILKEGETRKGVLFLFANTGSLLFVTTFVIHEFSHINIGLKSPEALFLIDGWIIFFLFLMSFDLLFEIKQKGKIEKELANQMDRWHQMLNEVEFVIVELDPQGNILYVNPYFIKVSGFDSADIMCKNWFETFIPEGNKSQLLEIHQRVLKGGAPYFYQNSIQTMGGDLKMIYWSNVILKDSDKKPVGTLSIGTDVTDREKAFEEIRNLKLSLEEENITLIDELLLKGNYNIIGESEVIKYSMQKVRQVAKSNSTVLIQGETGVGKELFAHAIHMESKRKSRMFIKVNCAALPTDLMESELFGHERGAFTGAHQLKKGRFELANGGTIFLDEIGELPLQLQPKLLRVLQDGEFERLGSEKTIKTDVRIISATNRNLAKEVEMGTFREDLFYRLNVYPITIPPLRERKEDIPLLTDFLVNQIASDQGKTIKRIAKGVKLRLAEYDWPGNVRELNNILERAVIHASGNSIGNIEILGADSPQRGNEEFVSLPQMEEAYIRQVLDKTRWKISGKKSASEILGINANTLRSRMQKLGISKDEF